MTPGDRATAQAALNDGRSVYGRLDQIRGPEDAAADIIELWSTAESAMRAMLGGSSLSGQALVRELRQRGVLSLEQANAIAAFWDARTRAADVAYKPTLSDVGFARAGYNELVRAANDTSGQPASAAGAVPPVSTFAPGGMAAGAAAARADVKGAAPAPPPATPPVATSPVRRTVPLPAIIAGVVALILIIAAAAYFSVGRSTYDSDMSNAITLMQTGRTEAARAAFGTIARQYPDKAAPHVFLSRLARSDSPPDMNTARDELVTAIRLEPNFEPALREMGVFQLAAHNPSLARNFLLHAVHVAPNDSAAQGYLGCALVGMNQLDVAQKFLARAGTGTWSSCATVVPGPPAPVVH